MLIEPRRSSRERATLGTTDGRAGISRDRHRSETAAGALEVDVERWQECSSRAPSLSVQIRVKIMKEDRGK